MTDVQRSYDDIKIGVKKALSDDDYLLDTIVAGLGSGIVIDADAITIDMAPTNALIEDTNDLVTASNVALGGIDTSVDLVKAAVDLTTTAVTSSNTKLDTLKTSTDAVKTSTDAITTKLDNIFTISNDGSPQVCSQPYLQALAEGDITGHIPWSKYGYNGAVGAAIEDIWAVGGEYVFPTAAMQMEVVSSSANDDSDGTGVRTIRINYLKSDFSEASTVVELNGTAAVLTSVSDIYRVNYVTTVTAGTGGRAAGNIDVRHIDNTPIYGRIQIGQNKCKDIRYTVPKGKELYVTELVMGCGAETAGYPCVFSTKAKYDNISQAATDFFIDYTEVILQDTSIRLPLECPTKFGEGIDIKASVVALQGLTAVATCVLRGWLETT